jgi:hypothetical protein
MDALATNDPVSEDRASVPQGFFSELFKIYKSRIWVSLVLVAIPVAVQILLGFAIMATVIFGGLGSIFLFHANGWIFYIGIFLLIIIFIVADVWLQCIFTLALFNTNLRYEEKLGIVASLRSMPKKAWSFILLSILSSILLGGAFILAIVPGIFLTVAFFLAIPVLLMEDQAGLDALLRSRDLTKGHWWYSFWRLLGVIIIPIVVTVLFEIVGTLLEPKFGMIGLIFTGLGYLIGFLAYPLIPAATAVLFRKFHAERPEIIKSSAGRRRKYALLVLPWIALFVLIMTIGIMSGRENRMSPTLYPQSLPQGSSMTSSVSSTVPPASLPSTSEINPPSAGVGEWSTATIRLPDGSASVCYSFKYPPTLSPSKKDSNEFFDSNGAGILASADWTDSLSAIIQDNKAAGFSGSEFSTTSGVQGMEFLYGGSGDNFVFYLPSSQAGKDFLITLSGLSGGSGSIVANLDIDTVEEMAGTLNTTCDQ